jgi:hypothetical protein
MPMQVNTSIRRPDRPPGGALYVSASGVAYQTRAYSKVDIAELVNDYGLESLTSTDRQFDFWFSPSTRGCHADPTDVLLDCC